MQPLTVDGLRSENDTVHILRDAAAVESYAGIEIINRNLEVLDDMSDEFLGGSISRDSYATLHGSGQLDLTTQLDWGRAIVRPYVVYVVDGTEIRFNLGAYFTSVPRFNTGEDPITYHVEAVDILDALDVGVGDSVNYPAGTNVVDTVADIFESLGYTQFTIDPAGSSAVLSTAKSWPLDDQTSWLKIVNDLLSLIGYRGVYSDWDGRLRCDQYIPPADRSPEWTYSDEDATTMHDDDISVELDLYRAVNNWVAIRSNIAEGVTPVEGNGLYVYQNDNIGPTSVEARDGRIFRKTVYFEATSQASLQAQAQITIDADMLNPTKYSLQTSPNPLHWHFDRVEITDEKLNANVQAMVTSWTLPIGSNDNMTHSWVTVGEQ